MTNLQNVTAPDVALEERRSPQSLLVGLPLAVGGGLALLLLGAWVTPVALQLVSDWQRVRTLDSKKQQLLLARAQLQQVMTRQEQAADAERRLLGLIAGSGNISTFMAQVNIEAQRHGVRLDQLQPALAAPAATDKTKTKEQAETQAEDEARGCGALASSGFTSQRRSLVATGRYPNLLAFMRALENLSLLVVQCDLALEQPPPKQTSRNPSQPPPPPPPMQVRFELSLFEKGTPAAAPAPAKPSAAAQP